MTPTELMYKMFFVKRWRAWPYYDPYTKELRHYTIECRIDRTQYTPQMEYRQRINPIELASAIGSDDLTFLRPMFREMTARMDKGLEDYVANL
jgi:hypothetical protein